MIKKNLMKSLSVVLACMLAISTIGCGANTTVENKADKVQIKDVSSIEESLLSQNILNNTETSADKVETVYVLTDATGAVNDNIIVSEWLKNEDYSKNLVDETQLDDIENVKGNEDYVKNSDGTITWDAEGSDIYYQGTTQKQLPVDIKISYTLDGKEISPEDLAGKSGKVVIRFDYENKSEQTIDVNGEKITVYTPFALVSGMMLNADKFANVEISNGKVISEGNNYIVMGVAVPGLKESLDISDENWDKLNINEDVDKKLSNSFEITADVKDFELGTTITMASSNILSDLGASNVVDASSIDNIKDDFGELKDGSIKLVNGAKDLKDGSGKLKDGIDTLNVGAKDLKDGTSQLKDGSMKLSDGTSTLKDGLVKYTNGTNQINDGAKNLSEGASAAKDGSLQLKNGIESAKDGAGKLADGSTQIKEGVQTLVTSISDMTASSLESIENSQKCLNAAIAYFEGNTSYSEAVAIGLRMIGLDKNSADKIIEDNKNAYITLDTLNQNMTQKTQEISDANAAINNGINQINTAKTMLENAETNSVEMQTHYAQPNEDIEIKIIKKDDSSKLNNNEQFDENIKKENESTQEETQPEQENTNNETILDEQKSIEDTKVLGDTIPENSNLEQELNAANETINTLNTNLTALSTKSTAQSSIINSQTDIINNQQMLINGMLEYLATSNMSEQITNATTAIATYQSYLHAAQSAVATLDTVKSMLPNMADGATAAKLNILIQGTKDLENGAIRLDDGLAKLVNGSSKLDNGLEQLSDGSSKLYNGTKELVTNNDALLTGANDLNTGANKLSEGASKLDNGMSDLYDGTNKLNNGVSALDEGISTLLDGVTKFDEEGIEKLYEAFDGDLGEFANRIEAIKEAGENYTTFGGANKDTNSSVKFIIKTDSIK